MLNTEIIQVGMHGADWAMIPGHANSSYGHPGGSRREVSSAVRPTCMLPEFVPLFVPWPLSIPQAWRESALPNGPTEPVQNRWAAIRSHALDLISPHYLADAQILKGDPIHFHPRNLQVRGISSKGGGGAPTLPSQLARQEGCHWRRAGVLA